MMFDDDDHFDDHGVVARTRRWWWWWWCGGEKIREFDVNDDDDADIYIYICMKYFFFFFFNWKTKRNEEKEAPFTKSDLMGMWHRATTTTTTTTVPTTKRNVKGWWSRPTTTTTKRRTPPPPTTSAAAQKKSSKQQSASEKDDDDDDDERRRHHQRRAIVLTTAAACVVSNVRAPAWEGGGHPTAAAYEDEKTVPAHQTEDMPPVAYINYTDEDRGFSMKVPRDWQMDAPNGVLEREFHPRAEYGGRRCTVRVSTVGKVETISSNNGVAKLRDVGAEEYKSAEKLGETRANDFAPLDGETGGAKAATFLVKSEEKDDGSLYFYEWRSQALLNFHFWEVAVLGPGPKGAGRKLGRRDIITVKCQMPEDGMTPGDVEIFETITQSLKLLPEEEMDVNAEF